MNILFKIKNDYTGSTPSVCSVPEELNNGTLEGIENIGDVVCDCANNLVTVLWKFEDEPDDKYREASFPTWKQVEELIVESKSFSLESQFHT